MRTPFCVFGIISLITPAVAQTGLRKSDHASNSKYKCFGRAVRSVIASSRPSVPSNPDHDDCKGQEHQFIKNMEEAAGFALENKAADDRRKQNCQNTGLGAAVPTRDRDCRQCKCSKRMRQIEVVKQKIQRQSASDRSESQPIAERERRTRAHQLFGGS